MIGMLLMLHYPGVRATAIFPRKYKLNFVTF